MDLYLCFHTETYSICSYLNVICLLGRTKLRIIVINATGNCPKFRRCRSKTMAIMIIMIMRNGLTHLFCFLAEPT